MSLDYKELERICVKVTDGSHETPKFVKSSYPFVTVKDVKNDAIDFTNCSFISKEDFLRLKDNCNPRKGDILFSKDGTVGKVVEIEEDREFIVLSSLAIIRPDPLLVDRKYLKYFLRSEGLEQAIHMKTGSAIRRVIVRDIKRIRVPMLPVRDQRRIGVALQGADTLLRRRKEANQFTGKIIQSVFLRMFGDPVSNPFGWKTVTIGNVCSDIIDCPHTTPVYRDTGIRLVRTPNIKKGFIDLTETRFISATEHEARSRRISPRLGDILYAREATFGNAGLVEGSEDFSVGQRIMLLRPDSKVVTSAFLTWMINSDYVYNQAKRLAVGSTNPHVNVQDVKKFKVMVPPFQLQQKFTAALSHYNLLREKQQDSEREIKSLFNALTSKAFRGELTAPVRLS